jgi:hypothetical protein
MKEKRKEKREKRKTGWTLLLPRKWQRDAREKSWKNVGESGEKRSGKRAVTGVKGRLIDLISVKEKR